MEQVLTKPKVTDLPSGKLVEVYIELRDRQAKRKAAYETEDAGDKAKKEKIEGILLQRFREEGIDSVKSPAGTAYTKTSSYVSVADKATFCEWADGQDDRWEFLDVKANKTNIVAYREEHDDLPPGINWLEKIEVQVRRS